MAKKELLLTPLILIAMSCGLYAQMGELRFHHISIEDGLSQSTVQVMLQDRDGFLWLGTQDGLNRYDGYNMAVYRSDPDDPGSLTHGDIRVIYEDRDGVLWIGTQAGGLNRYDRDRDRFTHYQGDADDYQTLSSNTVWGLLEDSRGRFWVGTAFGLNLMDREEETFQRIHPGFEEGGSISSNQITAFLECDSGDIWVGTANGLNRKHTEDISFEQPSAEEEGLLENAFIRTIYQDRYGVIWVGTEEDGVFYREPGEELFRNEQYRSDDPGSLHDNTIYDILEDAQGQLWIGSGNRGLNLYDREADRFYHYVQDRENPHSLSSNGVNSLYVTEDGRLWVGTAAGGVNLLDARADRFGHYQSSPVNPYSLSHNTVRSFLQDDSGRIWIGTDGGGLNLYDPNTGRFTHHIYDSENAPPLSSDVILALVESDRGIWVGTYNGGLDLFDPESGSVRNFRHDPGSPESLASDYVFVLHEGEDGALWVGLNRGGVGRMDPGTSSFVRYRADPARPHDPSTLNNDDIRAIYEDSRGEIWVGNYGARNLVRYNREEGVFDFFDLSRGQEFYSSAVQAIYEDRQHRFWLASDGGGLILFDRDREEFTSYTVRDGLPNNVIHAVVEDDHGQLWLSSNNGISRFNPELEEFYNYNVEDGLQSREFNPRAAYRDREGFLYFGGVNGFNRFHPDSIRVDSLVPPVVLTDFQIFNRAVPVGDDSPLQKQISQTSEIILPHDASVISFEYSMLDFSAVKSNEFAYKMEGFEEEWNYVEDLRRATYTNLDPGSYTFRVRAANSDGIWNEEGTSLSVVITPPFWRTGWFRVLMALLLLGVVGLVFQYRVHSIRRQNRRLATLIHERTRELKSANATKDRLFSIIGHDLNNVAGGLSGLSELLLDSVEKREYDEVKEYSGYLHESSVQLTSLLRNLLDWARSQTGRIEFRPSHFPIADHIHDVINQEKGKASNKEIRLSSSVDPELNVFADPNMVSVILRNLVHNALKFTPRGGSVELKARPSHNGVEVSVIDSGIGMDRKTQTKLFDEEQELTTRGTDQERGTGLGLSLCRDFVNRNGGILTVESEKGKGSTFTFTLPVEAHASENQSGNRSQKQVVETVSDGDRTTR